MPNPASDVFTQAVGGIVPAFFSMGVAVLSAIGPALLGVAALFVLFYIVARSFGWHVKMPVRPGQKKGVIGNVRKLHLERGSPFSFRDSFNGLYSKFWDLQTPINSSERYFLRPFNGGGGGPFEGHASFGGGDFVEGFGADFMPLGDDDEWGSDWLDREDDHNAYYFDPSYEAAYTSDSGPDSSPGRQEGGYNSNISEAVRRASFHDQLGGAVCGGLYYGSYCFGPDVSEPAMPLRLAASNFIDSRHGSNPSWDFLSCRNLDGFDLVSADDLMRNTEKAWADMFGWNLALAPNETCAYSAETTYHALRIMEMVRMREMGFTGSYDEFWVGFDREAGLGDESDYGFQSDLTGDEDLSAYDH